MSRQAAACPGRFRAQGAAQRPRRELALPLGRRDIFFSSIVGGTPSSPLFLRKKKKKKKSIGKKWTEGHADYSLTNWLMNLAHLMRCLFTHDDARTTDGLRLRLRDRVRTLYSDEDAANARAAMHESPTKVSAACLQRSAASRRLTVGLHLAHSWTWRRR